MVTGLNVFRDYFADDNDKQGLGKPTKLYVHNFGRVWDANLQKYETHTHGSMQDI